MKNKTYASLFLATRSLSLIGTFIIILILSSCSSRYWYRPKINVTDNHSAVKRETVALVDSTLLETSEENRSACMDHDIMHQEYLSDSIENKSVKEPVSVNKVNVKKEKQDVPSQIVPHSSIESVNPNTLVFIGSILVLIGSLIMAIGVIVSSGDTLATYLVTGISFLMLGILVWLAALVINWLNE